MFGQIVNVGRGVDAQRPVADIDNVDVVLVVFVGYFTEDFFDEVLQIGRSHV
jgi:hypothetical protein